MAYTWKDGELITAEKLNNTGSDGLMIVNVVADAQVDAPPIVRSIDKKPDEIISAIETGNYTIARVIIDYPNESILYFLNPLKQVTLGESSKILLFWNSEASLMIPQDESLPVQITLSGGSSPGPLV